MGNATTGEAMAMPGAVMVAAAASACATGAFAVVEETDVSGASSGALLTRYLSFVPGSIAR